MDSVLSETTVKRWYADFKRGRIDTNVAERSGHTNSVVVPDHPTHKKIHKLVLVDRKLKLPAIEELKIGSQCIPYFV